MTERPPPPDQAARDRIAAELEATLFVEAGAGSGKTTTLVDRVLALVASGAAELHSIAAITFTEKAGAELRDRIRRRLEEQAAADPGGEAGSRCRAALDQLDGAAIGTLHAFAQRLLSEHPVEAALPPRVEVLDEVSSDVSFDRRWSAFQDQLLADPGEERTLLLLLAAGVPPKALRVLAVAFDRNWDLVEERVPATVPEPPDVSILLEPALAACEALCAERAGCRDGEDKLSRRLDDIAEYATRLGKIDDEIELLEALHPESPTRPSFKVGNIGSKGNWPGGIAGIRARVQAAGDGFAAVRDQVAKACGERLGSAIRRFTLGTAAERRAAGRLEFHDLLVLARALLRDPVSGAFVRSRLHQRYARLLLDEFQDTDPIQIELAVRIAAADPGSAEAGAAPWPEVPVAPGHLFVVGDPKQSIYRFRRADISVFLEARRRFGPEAGGAVELTANFRAGGVVIDRVNHIFSALFAEDTGTAVALPVPSQPEYVALTGLRPAPPEGPPVAVLGRDEHAQGTTADELRALEAAEVVAAVSRVVGEGWSVDDGAGGWRRARLGDVTILVPARTSLPFLEDALDGAGIAYRAESSSLVYATRAVRDLLIVLRAVDDPTNHLHIVAALRTPLLACGDDDLFRFKVGRGGHWNYLASQPGSVPANDPVRVGLDELRRLHEERRWRSPSELLDRIARDRRAFELGFAEGRARDVWRRLRFVIDQARAWSDATAGNLRQYLGWVEQQTAEGARVAEAVLPETDDDAVRIMTIHAAKGLEFPVTIVSGLSTVPSSQRAAAEVAFPATGGVGYRFGRFVVTDEFAAWVPIDEQMGFHERIRLLYVACTRARDHLVVSLHRKARAHPPEPHKRTNAELLVEGMGALVADLPDAAGPAAAGAGVARPTGPAPGPLPSLERWREERDSALRRGARPGAVAATALTDEGAPDTGGEPAAGLQKRPRDLDLPPWLKGRYGTAVGRAVHGVLQTVDLASGAGLDAAVAAQCEAEAVPDRAEDVRRLAHSALGSPTVREAAIRPHWREVYACVPVSGRLLEGYIDLLYRAADGLVVVDYKTASSSDPAELDRRVAAYRLQGAAYALVAGAAAGEPVVGVTFLFLTPDGAFEHALGDLDGAVADVTALLAAGREVLVD